MGERHDPSGDGIRIDKWLWCARWYKTRTLAATAVRNGKVLVAGQRIKPSRLIHTGEVLQIRKGPYTWRLQVAALSNNRRSAATAAALYQEFDDSLAQRELVHQRLRDDARLRPVRKGRPTKKERRELNRFTAGSDQ